MRWPTRRGSPAWPPPVGKDDAGAPGGRAARLHLPHLRRRRDRQSAERPRRVRRRPPGAGHPRRSAAGAGALHRHQGRGRPPPGRRALPADRLGQRPARPDAGRLPGWPHGDPATVPLGADRAGPPRVRIPRRAVQRAFKTRRTDRLACRRAGRAHCGGRLSGRAGAPSRAPACGMVSGLPRRHRAARRARSGAHQRARHAPATVGPGGGPDRAPAQRQRAGRAFQRQPARRSASTSRCSSAYSSWRNCRRGTAIV